jgi:nucleotide-binding universal stress UspA family protein
MKVLIGYDGSACANDAIADLSRAGLPGDAQALVVAAAEVFPHLPPSSFEPVDDQNASVTVRRARELARQAMDDARELVEQGAARIRNAFPGWRVETAATGEAPHWALVGKAAEWGADLVVVGSHGRSALGRVVLGSVSQQVLHHAPCSVRIARAPQGGGGAADGPVRLVLGIDGSIDSATAASAVSQRAWPRGSEVLVVGVLDPRALLPMFEFSPPGVSWPAVRDEQPSSNLRDSLEQVCEDLRGAGLTATPSLTSGDPKAELLREAERHSADCIFLGAKGHSRLERLLLGSVSATVASRAGCSVEVVR